jgi:hypothetical protein
MLNPVFSVAHLRHMGKSSSTIHDFVLTLHPVPTFFKIGEQVCPNFVYRRVGLLRSSQLRSTFLAKVSNGDQEIEIVSWMTRIALEIFGQSGFGTSFAPVTEDSPEHPYASSVKDLTYVFPGF